jgi:GNAT superfamily N-acetyltransferase
VAVPLSRVRPVRLASAIRPATDREVPLAVDVLRRAGFGTQVARLLEFPRRSPDGAILVAEGESGGVVGVACCAAFASSGWIGALGVAPEARRRGLGAALTEAAVRWLRARGARTVLLYATEAGRPVYERLGFVTEERAIAWRGVAGAAPPLDLQRLADSDRARLRTLDQAVTGERRDNVLDTIHPLAGVAVAGGPYGLSGWAIASPWGAGTAIAALAPEDGVALMAAATGGPAAGTLIVPDTNHAATDALRAWRFVRLNDALRMRLGPAVAWHPEQQFGLFNLFWG